MSDDEDIKHDDASVRLYVLKTQAPYRIAREAALAIAQRFGYTALLSEVPDNVLIIARRPIWGPVRWWAVFIVLAGSPWFFGRVWHSATNLQGFGVGFIAATIILLVQRSERML